MLPPTTPPHRRARERRGTVIVLALAVLAIVSIAAVSYVSIVRIDRNSTAAVAREVNYQQQVKGVVAHLGALLTADLYGQKIVTNSVPRFDPGGAPIWPRAFEDGETWDHAFVDAELLDDPDDVELDPNKAGAKFFRVARPDESWLAASEPQWTGSNINATRVWPQVTNLRIGYRWRPINSTSDSGFWERLDGRFVDLLEWFVKKREGRGNPGLDLLGLPDTPAIDQADFIPPAGGVWNPANATNELLTTAVFGVQIADLDPNGVEGVLTNLDQRMWTDTDGDLRPDARWQTLPEVLGNLYGLLWVTAARVTDASGLLNYNVHQQFVYSGDYARASTGLTPADVDFYGVLEDAGSTGVYDAEVSIAQLPAAFELHLEEGGLRFSEDLTTELNQDAPYFVAPYTDWTPTLGLTREQRRAHYEYVGQSPTGSRVAGAGFYRDTDLIDLGPFWGTNSGALSRIEENLDGPNLQGFLPGQETNEGVWGPVRSRELGQLARTFDGVQGEGQPSTERLWLDLRRLLTPISGVGLFSPVPLVNPDHPAFGGAAPNLKISLPTLAQGPAALTNDDVVRVFDAIAWALAPESASEPVYPDSSIGGFGTDSSLHYGGGPGGPANVIEGGGAGLNGYGGTPMGAAYALRRALALAVNLIDAQDQAGFDEDAVAETPTAVRFWPNTNGSIDSIIEQDTTDTILNDDGVFEVNPLFTFGTPPADQMPQEYLGQDDLGITAVGLDRQPFIMEAHTVAVYASDTGAGATTISFNPTQANQQVGSIVAVQLGNPWADELLLQNYRLELCDGSTRIILDLSKVHPDQPTPASPTIPAGSSRVVFYDRFNPDAALVPPGQEIGYDLLWPEVLQGWIDAGGLSEGDDFLRLGNIDNGDNALLLTDLSYTELSDADDKAIIFDDFISTQASVLLHHVERDATGLNTRVLPRAVLMDRLSPSPSATARFPFVPPFIDPISLDPGDKGNGRVAYTASLYRPDDSGAAAGFPAYVVERPDLNQIDQNDAGTRLEQSWVTEDSLGGPPEARPDGVDLIVDHPAIYKFEVTTKATFTVAGVPLPSFQLFVPNVPFKTQADVLLTPAFAHTYTHRSGEVLVEPAFVNGETPPELLWRYDLVRDAWNTAVAKVGPGAWLTMSEQLGLDAHLTYSDQGFSGAGVANPYLGALDPTRFQLADADLGGRAPEIYGVPPAVRLVDCFEVLDPIGDLIEGRININSAPLRVLEAIPFMKPTTAITSIGGAVLSPDVGFPGERIRAVQLHRDRRDLFGATSQPWAETNLTGFRETNQNNGSLAPNQARGFVTAAEAALLDVWQAGPTGLYQGTPLRFGQLGAGGATDGVPLELYSGTANADTDPFGEPAQNTDGFYGQAAFNPIDDPEERTAIYRAMSNTITSRSDLFFATFVLRGYDPAVIDGIEVDADFGGDAEAAMDSEDFSPAYQSRWLAVFDRSGVRSPTDRPRLLKLIQLPEVNP